MLGLVGKVVRMAILAVLPQTPLWLGLQGLRVVVFPAVARLRKQPKLK